MKIVAIDTLPIDQYLFVQVHTDEGITGLFQNLVDFRSELSKG